VPTNGCDRITDPILYKRLPDRISEEITMPYGSKIQQQLKELKEEKAARSAAKLQEETPDVGDIKEDVIDALEDKEAEVAEAAEDAAMDAAADTTGVPKWKLLMAKICSCWA
jgi:hypothetical protein